MATAIAEQIAATVKTRLALISTGAGYETTTSGVVRPVRLNNARPLDYQIFVTQGDITRVPELDCPGNPPATARVIPFSIAGILRPSDTDTTAIDTIKNQFWADVVRSLCNAVAWWNWGGLAVNSDIGDVEDYATDDGSSAGFKVALNVTYRTDETNPYNVRG